MGSYNLKLETVNWKHSRVPINGSDFVLREAARNKHFKMLTPCLLGLTAVFDSIDDLVFYYLYRSKYFFIPLSILVFDDRL